MSSLNFGNNLIKVKGKRVATITKKAVSHSNPSNTNGKGELSCNIALHRITTIRDYEDAMTEIIDLLTDEMEERLNHGT